MTQTQGIFPISILTNGCFVAKEKQHLKTYDFSPLPRQVLGLRAYFDCCTYNAYTPQDFAFVREMEVQISRAELELNTLTEDFIKSKRGITIEHVNEIDELVSERRKTLENYCQEASHRNAKKNIAVFNSSLGQVGFVASLDEAMNIVALAQSGKIVELHFNKDGTHMDILTQSPTHPKIPRRKMKAF